MTLARKTYVWASFLITMAVIVGTFAIGRYQVLRVEAVFIFCVTAPMATVGFIIATRRAGHNVGLVFLTLGLLGAAGSFSDAYSDAGLPGSIWINFAFSKSFILFWGLLAAIFYLFPTGSLLSRAWRYPARACVAGVVLAATALQLKPGPLDDESPLSARNPENPLAAQGTLADALAIVELVGGILLLVGAAASIVSLIVRYRRARGIEALQLKAFVLASVVFAGVFIAGLFIRNADWGVRVETIDVVIGLAFVGIPVSAGVAILKYRLYEIDVVVNKALVYGALSIMLTLVYVGIVTLLQAILPLEGNDFAVAASTLTVAALFAPLRTRVQGEVDQRFYRRKYDAVQTIEAFQARLRDELDLENLRADLLRVVVSTVQPVHVSLWLRTP